MPTRPDAAAIGQRLKEAMVAAGVGNQAVADAAGVHVKTVSAWRSGSFPPSLENLQAVAPLLGVSVDWIRKGAADVTAERQSYEAAAVERHSPRVMAGLPFAVREWIQEFLLRLVRARVTEREFDRARSLLESEELSAWYGEGSGTRPPTEAEMLESVQAAGDFILGELRKRGYKLEER